MAVGIVSLESYQTVLLLPADMFIGSTLGVSSFGFDRHYLETWRAFPVI
jgi:hypothetical protein